ncbi:MAG: ATP synthase F0 subunit B [bacterium]
MAQLFAAFGVDWRLLVINIINFSLLLLALWYFLYEPLTTMLAARRQKMADGVRDADKARHHLKRIEESRAELLAQAGKDADEVVAKARVSAGEKQQQIVAQGEAAAAALLQEAEARAAEMKHAAIVESKQEVAKLIVLGMERASLQSK